MSKEFVDGLIARPPKGKAKNFVKANILLQKERIQKWLEDKPNWIELEVKISKKGKWYAEWRKR